MSNLTLKKMNLVSLLNYKPVNNRTKLGNNTYSYVTDDKQTASITYHGNTIAMVSFAVPSDYFSELMLLNLAKRLTDSGVDVDAEDFVQVLVISDCGYGTVTTRNRINMILSDNKVDARVTQKNFEQRLLIGDDWNTNHYTPTGRGYYEQNEATFVRLFNGSEFTWVLVPPKTA